VQKVRKPKSAARSQMTSGKLAPNRPRQRSGAADGHSR